MATVIGVRARTRAATAAAGCPNTRFTQECGIQMVPRAATTIGTIICQVP